MSLLFLIIPLNTNKGTKIPVSVSCWLEFNPCIGLLARIKDTDIVFFYSSFESISANFDIVPGMSIC